VAIGMEMETKCNVNKCGEDMEKQERKRVVCSDCGLAL
jgi:hypothetical protein